jgi:hypothetical protein
LLEYIMMSVKYLLGDADSPICLLETTQDKELSPCLPVDFFQKCPNFVPQHSFCIPR